jgi:hypothetical protein
LGRSQWQRDPLFNGSYNEFRIWQGILTDQDVASHYAAGPDQQFVTTRPVMNLTRAGDTLLLSWPAEGTESFHLQSTTNLFGLTWAPVTNDVTLANGNYTVVLPANAAPAFYRLKQ